MSGIKQCVNIHPPCKTIGNGVFPVVFERFDMCCLQNLRHHHIGDHAPLTRLKDIFTESCLIGSSTSGLYPFSFNFGCNLTDSDLIQRFQKGFIFRLLTNDFLNFSKDIHIDVIYFLFSSSSVCFIKVSVIV